MRSSDVSVWMTISGGSLCAGTWRLTNGSSDGGAVTGAGQVTRRRHCSVPRASHSSHRYAQARIAARNSKIQSRSPPIVLGMPRWLANVHCKMNAREATNRKTLDTQHRWPRAFHRRVAGSHSRLAMTKAAAAAIATVREKPSTMSTPAMRAASTAVPISASTNRLVAGHTPAVLPRRSVGTNSAAELIGAVTSPANSSAASMIFYLHAGSGLPPRHPYPIGPAAHMPVNGGGHPHLPHGRAAQAARLACVGARRTVLPPLCPRPAAGWRASDPALAVRPG